ncbi:MAG: hypothetical protein JWM76_5258 [Pseudonocardiales bacterium]|nr:hypothetical protein [Pseudonocardiales bacterium]
MPTSPVVCPDVAPSVSAKNEFGHHSRLRRTAAAVAFIAMAAIGVSIVQPADAAAPLTDRVASGGTLDSGSTIGNSQYLLTMQADGNLVEYGNGHAMWSTGTQNPGAHLQLQPDGNLVVYSASGQALWSSVTYGHGASTLVVQSDGNLILSAGSSVTWANMAPGAGTLSAGATLTSGQGLHSADWRFWLTMQADGNVVQYADGHAVWSTSTSGAGSRLVLQTDGNVVVYGADNAATWQAATFGANPVLAMQSDNNLVLYSSAGAVSLTHATPGPGSTPGSKDAGSAVVGSTTYPVPAGALFVATTGSDANTGAPASPLLTVAKAIASAKAGGTVVIGAGTYHETISVPAGKGLTIQSAPNAAVWFDGSSVVTGWVRSGSTWVRPGWTSQFDATPSYTGTIYTQAGWGFLNPSYPMAAHPDQVWIDGAALTQVASESAVVAGTFYTDYAGARLVIGSDPTAHELRASDLGIAMTITGASSTLRGIGIRRYATAVHDMGGVRVLGANAVVENVTITDMATTGISMLSAGDRVSHITLQRNGMLGMHGNQADGIVIEYALSTNNNTEHFNNSPVSGGIKISRTRTLTLRDSVLKDNYGPGLWLDESVYNSTITGNLITNNDGHGFSIEICDTALIADNTITDNRSDGLKINNTGNVRLWNNTFGGNGTNIEMLQDTRDQANAGDQGHDPRRPIPDPTMPWKVANISVMNTIFLQSDSHTTINIRDYTNTRSAAQMNISINGNLFTRAASGEILTVWQESGSALTLARTVAAIAVTGAGASNAENVVGQAPTATPARSFAQPLPADVATAISQPTGTRQVGAF